MLCSLLLYCTMCLCVYFFICVHLLTYALCCPISGHLPASSTILKTQHEGADIRTLGHRAQGHKGRRDVHRQHE